MVEVADVGAPLFLTDFTFKLIGHAREFGDHRIELDDATAFFLGLEPFETDKRIPRFHATNSATRLCETNS